MERARLRRLSWGEPADVSRLAAEFPSGFDVVLGADVVYAAEFVAQLFQTAAALISNRPEVWPFLTLPLDRKADCRFRGIRRIFPSLFLAVEFMPAG